MRAVGNNLNRMFRKFRRRNPSFRGPCSIVAHSLGSVAVFDLLSNQIRAAETALSHYAQSTDVLEKVVGGGWREAVGREGRGDTRSAERSREESAADERRCVGEPSTPGGAGSGDGRKQLRAMMERRIRWNATQVRERGRGTGLEGGDGGASVGVTPVSTPRRGHWREGRQWGGEGDGAERGRGDERAHAVRGLDAEELGRLELGPHVRKAVEMAGEREGRVAGEREGEGKSSGRVDEKGDVAHRRTGSRVSMFLEYDEEVGAGTMSVSLTPDSGGGQVVIRTRPGSSAGQEWGDQGDEEASLSVSEDGEECMAKERERVADIDREDKGYWYVGERPLEDGNEDKRGVEKEVDGGEKVGSGAESMEINEEGGTKNRGADGEQEGGEGGEDKKMSKDEEEREKEAAEARREVTGEVVKRRTLEDLWREVMEEDQGWLSRHPDEPVHGPAGSRTDYVQLDFDVDCVINLG